MGRSPSYGGCRDGRHFLESPVAMAFTTLPAFDGLEATDVERDVLEVDGSVAHLIEFTAAFVADFQTGVSSS